jgi:hypothetical protein
MAESVRWEPTCLIFPVGLTKPSAQQLRATNTTTETFSFKVKTTNPKRYSVRPNVGVVFPGQSTSVTVQLPAMKEAPADLHKCKDKFQVLTLKLDSEKSAELQALSGDALRAALTALWATEEAKNATVDKIKCAFAHDASNKEAAIPEEGPNVTPYSPEPSATSAALPPQTPYAEAASDWRAEATEEAAADAAVDDAPQPSTAPSTPQRAAAPITTGAAEDPTGAQSRQLAAAQAEAQAQRDLAAQHAAEVAALEQELAKQRKVLTHPTQHTRPLQHTLPPSPAIRNAPAAHAVRRGWVGELLA